jgi:porphobilinogen synthase
MITRSKNNFALRFSTATKQSRQQAQRTKIENIMTESHFPYQRLRRTRSTRFIRDMVAENSLSPADFIWPLFVCEGLNIYDPIASMPGVGRHSIDKIIEQAQKAVQLGIPAIALFPKTPEALKTAEGMEAVNAGNLICEAVREVKTAFPEIGIVCDVALDPYTDHGHDGLLDEAGQIVNDATVEILVEQARTLAEAGCDIIAPSDMMDGRVGAIRDMLEASNFPNVMIMSYAAKYASAFYGPFRDAVGAGSKLGGDGKKTYQMDPANSDEALREVAADIAEGADMVMVKPGMPYLDIIRRVTDSCNIPCFAYQVSGEYAMLNAAAEKGWLDRDAVMQESLLAFKRAGAAGILTYFAPEIAEKLA